jgi:predicted Zn-ribbon and HTH transcriptional regulator
MKRRNNRQQVRKHSTLSMDKSKQVLFAPGQLPPRSTQVSIDTSTQSHELTKEHQHSTLPFNLYPDCIHAPSTPTEVDSYLCRCGGQLSPPHFAIPTNNIVASEDKIPTKDRCEPCDRFFSSGAAKYLHDMAAATSKGRHSPLDCAECNRSFNTFDERLQHLYYDLEHWWRSPDLWSCVQCEASSYMKDVKIFFHESSGKAFVVPIPKHVCTGCGDEFLGNSRKLQKQQKCPENKMQSISGALTDVPETSLECTDCEKYFPANTNFDAHREYYEDKEKMLNGRAPDNLIYIEKMWRVHYHAALEKMLHSTDLLKKMEYIVDTPSREMLDGERHCINCHRRLFFPFEYQALT